MSDSHCCARVRAQQWISGRGARHAPEGERGPKQSEEHADEGRDR